MVPTDVKTDASTTSKVGKQRFWMSPGVVSRFLLSMRDLIAKYPDSVIIILSNGRYYFAKKGRYGGWLVRGLKKNEREELVNAIKNGTAIAVVPQLEVDYKELDNPVEFFNFLRKRLGNDVAKVVESLVKYGGKVRKKHVEGSIFIARPKVSRVDVNYIVLDFADSLGPIDVKTVGKYYLFDVPSIRGVPSKVIASSYYKRILKKAEKSGLDPEDVEKVVELVDDMFRVTDRPIEFEVPDDVAELLGLGEEEEEEKKRRDDEEEVLSEIDELAEMWGLGAEATRKKGRGKRQGKGSGVPTAVETKEKEEAKAVEEEVEKEVEEVEKRLPSEEMIAKKVEDFIKREGLIRSRVIVFDLPTEYRGAKVVTRKDDNNVVEEVRVFKTDPSEYRRVRVEFYNVLHRVAWRAKIGWVMYENVPLMAEDVKKLGELMLGLNQLAGTSRAVEVIDVYMPKKYVISELKAYIRKQADLAKQIREKLMAENLKKTTAKRLRRQLREIQAELTRLKKELEELTKT